MSNSSLEIAWAYGFSKDIIGSVHSLCTKERNALFFLSSHSGVIYDFEHRKQTILQGHCNIISCCIVDKTKRWIITADNGPDSILIVWDSFTCMPVKTFSTPHAHGVHALDISDDGTYIATISYVSPERNDAQEVAIWAWTAPEEQAIQRAVITLNEKRPFHTIKFNPSNPMELVTTSVDHVMYWDWSNNALESYVGKISKGDLGHYSGEFTSTIFLPDSETSLTSTSHGYVIVWENRSSRKVDVMKEDAEASSGGKAAGRTALKTAVKVVKILECGIHLMEVTANHYLVLGCADGAVRFYDYFLRLEAWFEEIGAGPIMSLSFAIQDCPYGPGEGGLPGSKFWVSDFILSTKSSFIVGLESHVFDEIRKEDRRGTLLMQGMSDAVQAVACHPTKPLLAILCRNGAIQLWNYEMKLLMNLRELFPPGPAASSAPGPGDGAPAGNTKTQKNGTSSAATAAGTTVVPKHTITGRDIAFHKDGELVAVALSNGTLKLLTTDTLQDVQTFSPNSDPLVTIKFSPSGKYLAAIDERFHVLLFQRDYDPAQPVTPSTPHQPIKPGTAAYGTTKDNGGFYYVGRTLAHTARIVGIEFGYRENTIETLISVSDDQYCVEYDLANTSLTSGLVPVKFLSPSLQSFSAVRLEKTAATPSCVLWCPKYEDDIEDKFVVMNSEFKAKEYNIDSKQCRKLTLAPRYGYPVTQMVLIPHTFTSLPPTASPNPASGGSLTDSVPAGTAAEQGSFLATYAFTTGERILGVGHFPLDGNPDQTMALVAHPGEITRIAVSYDGRYIFSAGGGDLTVNMWWFTEEVVTEQYVAAKQMMSFYGLLEDGPYGELHQNIIDYFYYCQLRHGGEDTMDMRALSGTIPLEEIPALVRAIGFYPTEEEVTQMMNEIRYKNFMMTGITQDTIGLDEFIRLYVNHRPALPLERHLVAEAMDIITSRITGDVNKALSWEQLAGLLTTEGEKIEPQDLQTFLGALIGDTLAVAPPPSQPPTQTGVPGEQLLHPDTRINASFFSAKILGFEED